MTRRKACVVALAAVLALAMGAAVDAGGIDPKVQKKVLVPVYNLSISKIEFNPVGGPVMNLPLNAETGGKVTKAGPHEVRVLVKNTGPQAHPDGDRHCEIEVKGGKQVGTYGLSYNKKVTTKVPAVPANQSKYCYVKLEDVKDPGNYFVYAKLKD
ncbi:MAG TPA: hypothetical protein VGT02_03685 [Methylomirabilota bacterium]|jgi:hypothetical protein|nr:hypothetical protein [Methylomirabilota bacterium]